MLRFHKVCIIALSKSNGFVSINPVLSADQAVEVVYSLLGGSHQKWLIYSSLLYQIAQTSEKKEDIQYKVSTEGCPDCADEPYKKMVMRLIEILSIFYFFMEIKHDPKI